MYYLKKYKYCPVCSADIIFKKEFVVCSQCKFRIYDVPKPCVNLFIENKKGEVLLVTRKIDPYKGWLDIPGGFLQVGESLEEAAKREALEEVGVKVRIDKIIGNYVTDYNYDNLLYKIIVFAVTAKIISGKISSGDDVSDHMFVPKKTLKGRKFCFPEINNNFVRDYLSLK